MQKASFSKRILPHIIAVVLFIGINLILYWPMFMEGKSINQNDILQGAGANQEIVEYREDTGKEALWTNGMFSGMPAYLINVQWSGDLSYYFAKILSFGLPSPASHTFMAMLAFYILLLVFRANPFAAIVGALAYGLNTYFLISIEAGHIWKVSAVSYMPLVLAGIILCFKGKRILGFAITALSLSLEIRSNHPQITYYLLIVVVLFGLFKLFEAFQNKTLPQFAKTIGILVLAAILGVSSNLGKLWTAYEYGQYSNRGPSELTNTDSRGGTNRDYAFQWSNGIAEPLTFLIPNYYGGATQEALSTNSKLAEGLRDRGAGAGQVKNFVANVPTYWGDQPFTSGPYYLGAIIIFLFALGCIVVKGPTKWWLVIATVLGIMLSWGDNFKLLNYFVFDFLPGYNKFRAVTNMVAIPFLTIPILAVLGLNKVIQEGWGKHKKAVFISFASVIGLCLLLILFSFGMSFRAPVDAQFGEQQRWLIELIREQRGSMLRSDAFRSIIFISLSFLVLYLLGKNKVKTPVALGALVLLAIVDNVSIDKRYLNDENFVDNLRRSYFAPSEADKRIQKDNGHHRVLNLATSTFQDAKTSYFHSSIGGYHGAKIRRYQELVEYQLQPEISSLIEQLRSQQLDGFDQFGVLNMLNTKYFKFGNQASQVIVNESALGNAWFVKEVIKVNSPDEEIQEVGTINTARTTVIDNSKFSLAADNINVGSIELTEYTPNYLKYTAKNSGDGLAVFSEVYYPKGWTATIDGKETEIKRVNFVLRALEVPAGEHTIEFTFEPKAYFIGNKVMWTGSILLIIVVLGALAYSIKREF